MGVPWEPYPGAKGGFELGVKSATTSRTSRVHGDRERQERLHEEKVPNTQRGYGEVRVQGRVPRMQSSEQRNDCNEPFVGVQKKACGRVGESRGREARLVRETERPFEHLEEEENKKKRARAGEDK